MKFSLEVLRILSLFLLHLRPGIASCVESTFELDLLTDEYPSETTWTLKNNDADEIIYSGGPYESSSTLYEVVECIPTDASYTFTILDSYGDGLCCAYGVGSYSVYFDGDLVKSGSIFYSAESVDFGRRTIVPCLQSEFQLNLFTDNYPYETTWTLRNNCVDEIIHSGGPYESRLTLFTENECVPTVGSYTFTILDSYGDGLCCMYGEGRYAVLFNGSTIKSGAVFENSESVDFGSSCVPTPEPTSSPTISDQPTLEPSVSNAPTTSPRPTDTPSAPPSFVPTWGLDRVDDRNLPLDGSYEPDYDNEGSGVTVYVIDTGIRISHDDFEGRASYGINTIDDNFIADDCDGHGTHVAGTVGGRQWGVAKKVNLVAVKVLDCSGFGSTEGVIAGMNWIRENAVGPSAVNMSLGGSLSGAMNLAVRNLIAAGISVIVAAGNSNGSDACESSPAGEPSAITVASSTNTDARSVFSDVGFCVDIFAPGSEITSAWYSSDRSTNTISGTSMASPHVCGAVALLLGQEPNLQPDQVMELLSNSATKNVITDTRDSPNMLLFVGEVVPTASPTTTPSLPPTTSPQPTSSPNPTGTASNRPTEAIVETVIDNNVIMLGVNDEGQLHALGLPDATGLPEVGIRYYRDGSWYDASSHGDPCEGFGVSYQHVSNSEDFWGGANDCIGTFNMIPQPLIFGRETATTNTMLFDLEVKHEFKLSPYTQNLYEVEVTYTNQSPSETLRNLRYRRMMDWDIPPTPFSECVSIFFDSIPSSLEYVTDNGFEDLNPLVDASNNGISISCPGGLGCPVFDSGPVDHGAMFQFLFKDEDDNVIELGPGESFSFFMYYGAAPDKASAKNILGLVDTEIASFGYPPSDSDECRADEDGSPNVFMMGFRGVGGSAIPPRCPEDGDATFFAKSSTGNSGNRRTCSWLARRSAPGNIKKFCYQQQWGRGRPPAGQVCVKTCAEWEQWRLFDLNSSQQKKCLWLRKRDQARKDQICANNRSARRKCHITCGFCPW